METKVICIYFVSYCLRTFLSFYLASDFFKVRFFDIFGHPNASEPQIRAASGKKVLKLALVCN